MVPSHVKAVRLVLIDDDVLGVKARHRGHIERVTETVHFLDALDLVLDGHCLGGLVKDIFGRGLDF